MTHQHFIVTLNNGETCKTKTLCAALKICCRYVGAHHIKSHSEIKRLIFKFWLHNFQLTLKSGIHAATVKRI